MKRDRKITDCLPCKGTGEVMRKRFDGEAYTMHSETCFACNGKGYQQPYDRRRNARKKITNGEIYLSLMNRGLAEILTHREEL